MLALIDNVITNPAHSYFMKALSVPDEGVTPAIHPKLLGQLLAVPDEKTPTGIRDRAILAVFAYMALRVEEFHHIYVGNIARNGVLPHIAATPVNAWIALAKIENDRRGPNFRTGLSARGSGRDGFNRSRLSVHSIQERIKKYCREFGMDEAVSVHSLRVTAATEADKAVDRHSNWLGHKDPRTTLRYIRGHEDLDRRPKRKFL